MSTPVYEWQRAVLGAGLPAPVFATVFALSTFADWNTGRNARPGETLLADRLKQSTRTIRRHLEVGRAAGWITRDETSNARARARGYADVYMLTIPGEAVSGAIDAAYAAAEDPTGTGHERPVDEPPSLRPAPDNDDSSTGQERPGAPDANVRTPSPTPGPRPISRAREAERALVGQVLAETTGKTIDPVDADAVIRGVLGGRTVRHRLAYLRAAIEDDPRRWLPTPIPPRFVRGEVAR